MEPINYRNRLRELYIKHTKNDSGLARVTARLKEEFPGNYTVVETFIPDRMTWGPKLVFENEQEEVMFRLKYE